MDDMTTRVCVHSQMKWLIFMDISVIHSNCVHRGAENGSLYLCVSLALSLCLVAQKGILPVACQGTQTKPLCAGCAAGRMDADAVAHICFLRRFAMVRR